MTKLSIEGFEVGIVQKGGAYGLNKCLTHTKDDPLVEFYTAKGQFVSRYYLSTLMESTGGLNLEGNVPEWQISNEGMNRVRYWLMTV